MRSGVRSSLAPLMIPRVCDDWRYPPIIVGQAHGKHGEPFRSHSETSLSILVGSSIAETCGIRDKRATRRKKDGHVTKKPKTEALVAKAQAELDPLVEEIGTAIGMSPALRKTLHEEFQVCMLAQLDPHGVRALNAVARARAIGTGDAVFIAVLRSIAFYACELCADKIIADQQRRLLDLAREAGRCIDFLLFQPEYEPG